MSRAGTNSGRLFSVAALGAAVALSACAGQRTTPLTALAGSEAASATRSGDVARRSSISQGKIQHVIFVIQENRSFDDLFQGYPGADTKARGLLSNGQWVRLAPISLAAPYDIDHSSVSFFEAYDDGKMDGFDKEWNGAPPSEYRYPQYGYVPHTESTLYFQMASQYVLADRMFTSHIDASYVSHQYAIAAQANRAVDFPTGVWGCEKFQDQITILTQRRTYGHVEPVCQNYQTLGDELDAAGLTWRFYAYSKESIWAAYHSIRHIFYGPDWSNVIPHSSRVLTDIRQGNLANVVWVTPTGQNSDHGGSLSTSGPEWVASIVNAVGRSQYWDSTAIFVMWDEWGGWYDHVPPVYEDFDGLGFRVPLLMISPYVKQGYVTHVQYEHGSVLRFIEDNWGLAQLAASDARANDPANDAFDFSQPPRTFKPFKTKLSADDFIRREQTEKQFEPDSE